MPGLFDKSSTPAVGEGPAASPRGRPAWLANWLERHQHPVSFGLHVVGIPLTVVAVVLAGVQLAVWRWDLWYRPALLFLGGYALQWLGHLIEGNDMGEVILIKKWRGRAYVAIAPRYQRASAREAGAATSGADSETP